jgi:hypothetical protein
MNYRKTKVFISFDFDHDQDLKNLFAGQAQHDDTPFEISDLSVKQALFGDWRAKVRQRISNAEQVVVICGEYTHTATGVSDELRMAQELNKPYFLVKGRSNKNCSWPSGSKSSDKMYNWTWENISLLLQGNR